MDNKEMKKKFDITVIGGGPGGYVAAIRAAQQGANVALVERGLMGGTCLNWGCIPTKTLIANSDVLRKVQEAHDYGISVEKFSFDFARMKQRKDQVVTKIRTSLEGLIATNKISVMRGHAKFIGPQEIKVMGQESCFIESSKFILATGSEPRDIPAFPFDHQKILSSTSILELAQLPKKLAIVGGGIIGCEFASLYHSLGVEVTVVEMLPMLISTEGADMGRFLANSFEKRGIKVLLDAPVQGIDRVATGIKIQLQNGSSVEADMALVAVGRKLNTDEMDLEKAGVKVHERGFIPVNDKMETNVPHIYAIGDITATVMLAHVASHQGIVAADNALGKQTKMHYSAIPSVTFTHPEIGTVGMSLEKAKAAGYDAVVGKFPFQALGKSQAALETEGFAQVIVDKKTGQILGAQVAGYEAGTLIAQMAQAIANELTTESVAETVHAHPTISEAWLEATLVAMGTPIHLPPKASVKANAKAT